MAIKALVDALNQSDVMAFPQKSNPKRVSMSAKEDDNIRYFLTRVATGEIDANGKAKYIWARGNAMRTQ